MKLVRVLDDDGAAKTSIPLDTRVSLYRHATAAPLRRAHDRVAGARAGSASTARRPARKRRPSPSRSPRDQPTGCFRRCARAARCSCAACPFPRTSLSCSAARAIRSRAGKCPATSRALGFGRVVVERDRDSIAAGRRTAMAMRASGRADAAVAFLGDGATSHPDFHAALNFAGRVSPRCCSCARTAIRVSVPSGPPDGLEHVRREGAGLRRERRASGRQRRAGRVRGRARSARTRPRRWRSDARRVRHLPARRSLFERRPFPLSRRLRGRAMAEEGSAREALATPRARIATRRRHRPGHRRRARSGGRPGAGRARRVGLPPPLEVCSTACTASCPGTCPNGEVSSRR